MAETNPFAKFAAPSPSADDNPFARFSPAKLPDNQAQTDYGLNFSAPEADVRSRIESLPETEQKRARDLWADAVIQKERASGFKPLPDVAKGIPVIGPYLDEAAAAVTGAIHSVVPGFGRPYEEELAVQRARERASTAESPALSASSRLAAGVVTGGPILSRLAPAATLIGRIGQGVAIGAPLGAVEGFGSGEGTTGNRLETAKEGTKVGTFLGIGFPLLGALGTRAIGAAAEYVSPTLTRLRRGPEEAADEILARRIERESSSPAQKRLDLQRGQAVDSRFNSNSNAALPEALIDTSDDMRRLGGTLYRQGGEAGNLIKETLESRQRGPENMFGRRATGAAPVGQHERLVDATERVLLIRSSDTARRTEAQLMRDQAREGRRLYEQARQNSEPFDLQPVVDGMSLKMQDYPPPFAAKMQQAIDLFTRPVKTAGAAREDAIVLKMQRVAEDEARFASRLQPGPQLDKLREEYGVKMQRLTQDLGIVQTQNRVFSAQRRPIDTVARVDAAKKALDDMIDTAQRQGEGNLVRELAVFKDDVLNAVHRYDQQGNPTLNRPYHEARQAWGSAAENRQAIDLGRTALRENSEVSVDQFRELTAGQQQLFRLGFLESARNALATKRPGNDITQLFQQRRVQDLMREIIPRPQGRNAVFANRPERFGELMRREQRMVSTRNQVLGGSPTQQRQMDDLGFTGDTLSGMWNRFRSSPSLFNIGIEAIGTGIQRIFGYRQDVALALARRILETNPTQRNQILRRLQRRGGADRWTEFARIVDQSSNALIGVTAGPVNDGNSIEAR